MAFVPVGGTYTMDFKEAASLINEIKPKIAIPIHYGSIVGTEQDAIDFIDDNFYKKDMSLNMVAGEIGANASYLSSIFKKEKGCSLSRYLTQVRLEQAKKYLIEYPDKTLIDISESVGYSDVYYFSKNFKKYYGISPSKYMEERKN